MARNESTAAAGGGELDARYLQAVAQLGQRALIASDFNGLLQDGVEMVARILGVDYVHVLEHDADAGEFVLRQTHGFIPEAHRRVRDGVDLQPGYALHHRVPVVIDDVAAEKRFLVNPLLKALNVASALTVVIRGPGRPYGVLGASTRQPRSFRPDEVDFAQSMANVLGTAAARSRVDAALRADRERLRLALDAGGMGDWEWDLVTNRVSWSESMHHVFGVEPGAFGGGFEEYVALIHPEDRDQVVNTISAATEDGNDAFAVEHRTLRPDGSTRWISGSGMVVRDEAGNAVGMIGVGCDITERVEAEYKQALLFAAEQEARAEAEAARDRLEFLAEASDLLASSLDYSQTLGQVVELAVSRLADWCCIEVLGDDGGEQATVLTAGDAGDAAAPSSQVLDVVATGSPVLSPSTLVVPMTARGRTMGALSLASTPDGRAFTEDDLALALDLARRAAVAIDNARLYAERSQVAEALQRSLLPPSRPEIPGLDVAARYRPIGHGSEIGGDFYDVFEAREGSWAVVIGDVCGKGPAAADLTGLARDTVRGLSIRERSPRRVLRVLNEVVLRRGEETRFLTIAMARLEVDETGARMRVACAGHPPPLLRRADGSVDEAGVPALLLGLFPEIDPVDAHIELRPGDALVLFTDGVIEAHGPDGLYGEERLRALVASAGDADADTLAQAIMDDVDRYRPGPPQDDVAVVVVRVPGPAA